RARPVGVPADVCDLGLRGRGQERARAHAAGRQPGEPGAADPGALQGQARHRGGIATRARDRGPGHAAGRRPGAAAHRDVQPPRGYRMLAMIPRLPETVIDRIVEQFLSLPRIMRATIDDLDDVDSVGEARARAVKEGLARLAETSLLDRYI